jgi:phage shock protein PspC (stress-responsive transcriptional regulator)
MDTETVVVSGIVGVATSALTAYVTALLKMREERKKWDREFAMKYAEAAFANRGVAEGLARQFAVGFLIVQHPDGEKDKVFIPQGGRISVGRRPTSEVFIPDPMVSRDAAVIEAEGASVFVIDLGSRHRIFLNDALLEGGSRSRLKTGDVIKLGNTTLTFQDMERVG